MKRLLDPVECRRVTDLYPLYFTFDAEEWLSDERNFAYIEGENIGFGEWKSEGTYWVHQCLHTARGRAAVDMVSRMFQRLCEDTGLKAAIGLIPVDNKPAKWVVRQVGFTSWGLIETKDDLCEMFYREGLK